MDWTYVLNLVRPELLVLVALLWCIGLFLKKAPSFTQEWLIPFIMLAISIVMTILYIGFVLGEGFAPNVIVSGIIQAVIIAAITVYSNEIIKQVTVKKEDDQGTL
jgi:hypothetical protein